MRFPLFALVAPVFTSLLMWMVTGSAFTLLFAILGPVMAVGQYVDGKIHARRESRRKLEQENEHELARLTELQTTRILERENLLKKYPPSSHFAHPGNMFRPPWSVQGGPESEGGEIRIGTTVRDGYPVVVDPHAGIAVEAPLVEAQSIMRALGCQIAWLQGERAMALVGWNTTAEPELSSWGKLPTPASVKIHQVVSGETFPVAVTYVLRSQHGKAELTNVIDPSADKVLLDVDLCTRAEANLILKKVQIEKSTQDWLAAPAYAFPEQLEAVLGAEGELSSSRESLVVHVGRDAQHPLLLDLVAAGPHAVVCGMTGSGKTEFLRTWLLAMMSTYSPAHLAVLLIDYKGGVGLSGLAGVPHVAGILTDLDHRSTQRAMRALRAEILFRENRLAQAKVSNVSELAEEVELPRLVVVIDEYRVLLEECSEAAAVFTDLAARGRSLGIHLILSTQRTDGVVSDAVLANCALRICFRVADKQDSYAMLGNHDGAELPHHPGRAVIVGNGLQQKEFHAACISEEDLGHVLSRSQEWRDKHPRWCLRPVWLPELPTQLDLTDAPAPIERSAWLGLVDIPEYQEQQWTGYAPEVMGNLLIRGATRSGKTSVMDALHKQLGGVMLRDAEVSWDAVVEYPQELFRPGAIIFLDDVENILSRYDMEHAEAFVHALTRRARAIQQVGGALVLGCGQHPRGLQQLLEQFPSEITLHSAQAPGRGAWNGHEIQAVTSSAVLFEEGDWGVFRCDPDKKYHIVTHRKHSMMDWLTETATGRVVDLSSDLMVESGRNSAVVVGTAEEWMLASRKILEHSADTLIVIDGCLSHELRGLRLRPGLFPHAEENTLLIMDASGQIVRAQCPLV